MAGTLPIGHWSWHERWLYPDQVRDMPDRPMQFVQHQQQRQEAHARRTAQDAAALARMHQTTNQQPTHAQSQYAETQQQQYQQTMRPQPPSQAPPQQQRQMQPHPSPSFSSSFQPDQQQYQQQQQSQQQFQQSSPSGFSLDLTAAKHQEEKEQQMQQAAFGSTSNAGVARNNPQALENGRFPSLPRRYRDGTFRRTTSEYCYTFRDPSHYSEDLGATSAASAAAAAAAASGSSTARVGPVPGSRLPVRERGRMNAPKTFLHHHFSAHYHESDEERARVRPEQHSFRLWGRINNAHCVTPYETESQRAFALGQLNKDPLPRDHFLRVEQKQYKDALVKFSGTFRTGK